MGSGEFSVQPWYFIMTTDNQGTDNGSIHVKSGKKTSQEGSHPQIMSIRLLGFLIEVFFAKIIYSSLRFCLPIQILIIYFLTLSLEGLWFGRQSVRIIVPSRLLQRVKWHKRATIHYCILSRSRVSFHLLY